MLSKHNLLDIENKILSVDQTRILILFNHYAKKALSLTGKALFVY
jgi:hypothetical protein